MPFLSLVFSGAWKIQRHTVGSGLGHLSSVLTSSHSSGGLLQFRDLLGKRTPVDVWNFSAGTVTGRAPVRVWEEGWGALFEDFRSLGVWRQRHAASQAALKRPLLKPWSISALLFLLAPSQVRRELSTETALMLRV